MCAGDRGVGYYAPASGAVAMDQAASRLRRNMPDPKPVVLLARLAVDRAFQGRGLGRSLMQDAARRVLPESTAVDPPSIQVMRHITPPAHT